MKENKSLDQSRRQFLSAVIPVCSATCLGLGGLSKREHSIIGKIKDQEKIHKFLKDYRTLSLRDYFRLTYREFVGLIGDLSKEFDKDKIFELIKKQTNEEMLQYGKNQANEVQKDYFKSYIDNFRGPQMEKMLTMEIVEDTDTVFEIQVTECVYADAFLHYHAGDIGYAKICCGDYGWAKGYHSNIVLTRDKTLMEGHTCCNHRYTWVG